MTVQNLSGFFVFSGFFSFSGFRFLFAALHFMKLMQMPFLQDIYRTIKFCFCDSIKDILIYIFQIIIPYAVYDFVLFVLLRTSHITFIMGK